MYKERLRELGQLSLKKQRFMGNFTNMYEHLKGGKEERGRIFSVVPRKRVKGNGNKLRNIEFNRTTIKNVYSGGAHTEQVA